jgi:hypothetical protein
MTTQISFPCDYAEGVICGRQGACRTCAVWDRILDQARIDLDICLLCGADRKVYREHFGKEHICYAGSKE